MFSISPSDENGNPVCISKASGPIHVINVVTRSVEGCLSNPVTISYAFQICTHFFQLAARFPLVSNFWGSDTLAINLDCGGLIIRWFQRDIDFPTSFFFTCDSAATFLRLSCLVTQLSHLSQAA